MIKSRNHTRDTRAGLEREINLLREASQKSGMMHLYRELQKVRLAPNGRLDLNTGSEMVIQDSKPVTFRNSA